MTRVKVCGIRRLEDARAAVKAGAWALGFIFHRPSPRFLEPREAAGLVERLRRELDRDLLVTGVFVDWPLEELNRVVEEVRLDAAQLHGNETPEYVARVEAKEVWKVLRLREPADLAALERYPPPWRVLLDAYSPKAAGGTGERCDWELASRAQERRPIILAGGIRPENAAEAIRTVHPEALDVSSGVERAPGVKDAARLEELFRAVREGDAG